MLQFILIASTVASYCQGFVLLKPSDVALRRCSTLRMYTERKGDVKEDLTGGSSGRKTVLQLFSDGENRQQLSQDDDDGSQNGCDSSTRDEVEEDVNAAEKEHDAAEAKLDAAKAKVDAAKKECDAAENEVETAQARLYAAQNAFLELDADVSAETDETSKRRKQFLAQTDETSKRRKQFLAKMAELNVTFAEQDLNIAQEGLSIAQMQLKAAVATSTEHRLDSQETRIRFVMPLDHNVINYTREFEENVASNVNTVNHGEFEDAIEELLRQVEGKDLSESRQKMVVIQRCRRAGKTFMLHAIASMLQQKEFMVLYFSLNDSSIFAPQAENALDGILARIAWEFSGRPEDFHIFRKRYSDFMAVHSWLTEHNVILLIDELNVIFPKDEKYDEMRGMLSDVIGRAGSGLMFSTHRRATAESLCNRGEPDPKKREIEWVRVPRIQNENCLWGLKEGIKKEKSFWSAVLRGRIPTLMVEDDGLINNYGNGIFVDESDLEERRLCLSAAITGNIQQLCKERRLFPAYSYTSERFVLDNDVPSYAWPPFMLANSAVLGKEAPILEATLTDPQVSEEKAFEALVQLSILLRMLSGEDHYLVPMNVNKKSDCHEKTEIYHVGEEVENVLQLINDVQKNFDGDEVVQQVLAIPLFDSFPTYDFFVLHKDGNSWKVAVGYQCKKGGKYPDANDKVHENVALSVWIEGDCKMYCISDKNKDQMKEQDGWILLGQSATRTLLGVSVSEALPQEDLIHDTNCCDAARSAPDQ